MPDNLIYLILGRATGQISAKEFEDQSGCTVEIIETSANEALCREVMEEGECLFRAIVQTPSSVRELSYQIDATKHLVVKRVA